MDEMVKWSLYHDFLTLLSDFLDGQKSEIVLTDDLKSIAQSHQLAPIVYYQTHDCSLRVKYLQAINSYTQRTALFHQIQEAFSDIPFYVAKGLTVAHYYPVPQLRTMGDSDIIVHEYDKERAENKLISLGFTAQSSEWREFEWHFNKQGLDFELHHQLLYDQEVNEDQEIAFANTAWEYVRNHELDINFHFVYLILHLKKHFLFQGVGIRQFMDLVAMSKNAGIDYIQIKLFLQQAGIEKFAGVCSALCLRWFNTALPVDTPEISDEFYKKATDTIIANGVFGFEVADNKEKNLLNSINKRGKVSAIIGHIFPSYKICSNTPKYKWIKSKPYLLPLLWIYRLFWALFTGKSKSSVEYMTAVAESDKAMAERNDELAAWGL